MTTWLAVSLIFIRDDFTMNEVRYGGHLESLAVSSPQFRTHILEETCFVIFLNWMGGLQFMGDEEDNVGCCLFDFKARETVQITLFYSYTQNLHTVFKNVHRKVSNF